MPRTRKSPDGLLESRPLYKNVMAVIALVAGLSALIIGVSNFLTPKQPEVVHDNTELIVDRSESMNQMWEGKTRLEVAKTAARSVLATIATAENLALRQFGGPCRGANTSIDVPFAQKNVQKVDRRLDSLSTSGVGGLSSAIREAIGDFEDQKHFEGANKRILVITASADMCHDSEVMAAIRDKLAADANGTYKIRVDFRFIGLDMNAAARQDLNGLAKLTGGQVAFANHPAEVDQLVHTILTSAGATAAPPAEENKTSVTEEVKAPVRQDTKALVNSLTAGVNHLNDALRNLSRHDFTAAQAALEAARQDEKQSDAALSGLGQGPRQEPFQELYQAASEGRAIHQQLLRQAEILVKLFQSNDAEGYQAAQSEFTRLASAFDHQAQHIDSLLAKL